MYVKYVYLYIDRIYVHEDPATPLVRFGIFLSLRPFLSRRRIVITKSFIKHASGQDDGSLALSTPDTRTNGRPRACVHFADRSPLLSLRRRPRPGAIAANIYFRYAIMRPRRGTRRSGFFNNIFYYYYFFFSTVGWKNILGVFDSYPLWRCYR